MTNEELVAELLKHDPKKEVWMRDEDGDLVDVGKVLVFDIESKPLIIMDITQYTVLNDLYENRRK